MNLPKRKSPRLKEYDYSTPGYYFITMCTHKKEKILCDVVSKDEGIVGAIHESPEVILSKRGSIVAEIIDNLPERLLVKINKYVIMPNHIHLIMVIEDNDALRACQESPLRSRELIGVAVGYIKMNASKRIHKEVTEGKIWQRSFHDHIIRGDEDYRKIWQYIDTNPARWENDCFYTE